MIRAETTSCKMRLDRDRKRLDIIRVIVIRRRHPQGRLRSHLPKHAKNFVADGRRGRRGILRIERHDQQAIAALHHKASIREAIEGLP